MKSSDNKTFDYIVVGGGILGTFHAYFLNQSGRKVLLLEKNATPSDASVRNFGMVATSSIAPPGKWQEFADVSNKIYRNLEGLIDYDISLRKNGSICVAETEQQSKVLKEYADISKRGEYFTQEETLKEFPYISPTYTKGSVFMPDDMSIDPTVFISIFQRYLKTHSDLTIVYNSLVQSVLEKDNFIEVKDQNGNIYETKRVVICNGTDYQNLFYEHFIQSGLVICKLQMMKSMPYEKLHSNILSGLSIMRYPGFSIAPSYPDLISQHNNDDFSKWGIHILLKQCDDGSVIIGDSHEYYSLGSFLSFDTKTEINKTILSYTRKMLKGKRLKIQKHWLGYYLVNPNDPVYSNQISENIFISTGIGGKGMSTGPGYSKFNVKKILNS